MTTASNAAGHAALAICESTLLALCERQIIDQKEVKGILEDAACAHRNAMPLAPTDATTHESAAILIEAIISGGNSIRHP